jgi:hypothetical protein
MFRLARLRQLKHTPLAATPHHLAIRLPETGSANRLHGNAQPWRKFPALSIVEFDRLRNPMFFFFAYRH